MSADIIQLVSQITRSRAIISSEYFYKFTYCKILSNFLYLKLTSLFPSKASKNRLNIFSGIN